MRAFWKSGEAFTWLTGLATCLGFLMIGALVLLILVNGLGIFWPERLEEFTLQDGSKILGEVWETEKVIDENGQESQRLRIKIGNRDFYGLDFRWVNEAEIASRNFPASAYTLERQAWGNFFGYLTQISVNEEAVAQTEQQTVALLPQYLDKASELSERIRAIEKGGIGDINYRLDEHRLELKRLRVREQGGENVTLDRQRIDDDIAKLNGKYAAFEEKLEALNEEGRSYQVTLKTADDRTKTISTLEIVRAYQPNSMSWFEKTGLYFSHISEYLGTGPREANMEGGVFPAIFGTVLMVLIMSVAVVPLGVLTAIYMREYAKQGPFVRAVRIAVNNLAGVPSIVFGIFGLGFFIYAVGGTIDQIFFPEQLPAPTFGTGGILWASLTLSLLTVPVVIVTTEEGLAAVPQSIREASLALGATKVETLWRVVLPSASPAILTGLILAMARAAGEVAPLMITGVVKLAPSLPLDEHLPFLHLERKFMHLGFHIYDVGFQSPNVEAALPMVYSTTLLLLLIVLGLNLTAILLRNRLHKRFSLRQL